MLKYILYWAFLMTESMLDTHFTSDCGSQKSKDSIADIVLSSMVTGSRSTINIKAFSVVYWELPLFKR